MVRDPPHAGEDGSYLLHDESSWFNGAQHPESQDKPLSSIRFPTLGKEAEGESNPFKFNLYLYALDQKLSSMFPCIQLNLN